ncbi:hypothetical protein Y032_0058g2849 [Ancylostoma ceylanicum]|uniref:Reverse transcriptase domain-containing protein n=1 Tax=Ancylostoma ceylanicum TaxID=53326 RepID=A0A016U4D6_9BILA|nr:hypothetical protein Y032_0058g2849 [Ancylostoma ceylanicum]
MPPISRNRKSALEHSNFVCSEISDLLKTGAVRKVNNSHLSSLHVHPLSVATGKKLRLVLDLSHLNKFVDAPKFKIDDLSKILHVLPYQGFMTTFDLKAGYHHIRMCPEHIKYLGFEWQGAYYQFVVLLFGLSSAPHIFTKILRPFIRKWRISGLGVAIYIDDGIVFDCCRQSCSRASSIVKEDLTAAGWHFAKEKCTWTPSRTATWLGFYIDLLKMSFSLSPERLTRAKQKLENFRYRYKPSLHDRLRWSGTLASIHLLMSDSDTRMTRAVSREIAAAQSQDWPLHRKWDVTKEELGELDYWKNRLHLNPQKSLFPPMEFKNWDKIINVDASAHSVGAVLLDRKGSSLARTFRELPSDLVDQSSTARELFAIKFGLETFADHVQSGVLLNTDNQAAAIICKKGSLNLQLHQLAQNIWDIQNAYNYPLLVAWIPRENNVEADEASRLMDFDDWRISDSIFESITNRWGTPSIDMFANDRNTKSDIFFSSSYCPGTSGIDAFEHTSAWKHGLLWLVPPVSLVGKTIRWAFHAKAFGILGCPLWTSQPYFPILKPGGTNWAHFVKDGILFPMGTKLLKDEALAGAFGSKFSKSPFIFLLVDFRDQPYQRKTLHF